jgi:hypothetical protein
VQHHAIVIVRHQLHSRDGIRVVQISRMRRPSVVDSRK